MAAAAKATVDAATVAAAAVAATGSFSNCSVNTSNLAGMPSKCSDATASQV